MAVLVVTHDPRQAKRMAKRVLHMRDGRIDQPSKSAPALSISARSPVARPRRTMPLISCPKITALFFLHHPFMPAPGAAWPACSRKPFSTSSLESPP